MLYCQISYSESGNYLKESVLAGVRFCDKICVFSGGFELKLELEFVKVGSAGIKPGLPKPNR